MKFQEDKMDICRLILVWPVFNSAGGICRKKIEKLTHLVYEASLDNSLWPELILELAEEVQFARESRFLADGVNGDISNLSTHFRRAFSISQRMVELQERETYLSSVLNSLSFALHYMTTMAEC